MQGKHVLIPIIVPGTLTANVDYSFKAPFDMQLVKVSSITDASTTFILDICENDTPDLDAYLDGKTVTGHATVATEYGESDFVGAVFPHITKGTQVIASIDYDGGASSDSANVSILLTFAEG